MGYIVNQDLKCLLNFFSGEPSFPKKNLAGKQFFLQVILFPFIF